MSIDVVHDTGDKKGLLLENIDQFRWKTKERQKVWQHRRVWTMKKYEIESINLSVFLITWLR